MNLFLESRHALNGARKEGLALEETHYVDVASEETEETGEYASPAEIEEALSSLSATDYQKLMLIAKFWRRSRGLHRLGIEPAEILSEAVVRTLEGKRRWRKGKVTIIKHFDEVMRSVSGHFLEKEETERQAAVSIYEFSQSLIHKRGEEKFVSSQSDVENQIIARAQLEKIESLFAADPIALKVLVLRAEEKEASEIRQELGISNIQYDTITKRIRRAFVRYSAI